jgi:hypothetical protein
MFLITYAHSIIPFFWASRGEKKKSKVRLQPHGSFARLSFQLLEKAHSSHSSRATGKAKEEKISLGGGMPSTNTLKCNNVVSC